MFFHVAYFWIKQTNKDMNLFDFLEGQGFWVGLNLFENPEDFLDYYSDYEKWDDAKELKKATVKIKRK